MKNYEIGGLIALLLALVLALLGEVSWWIFILFLLNSFSLNVVQIA